MNPDNIESNQLVLFSISLKVNIQAIWTSNVIWHFRKNFIKYNQAWKPILNFWVTSWPFIEGSHKLDLQEQYLNHKCF